VHAAHWGFGNYVPYKSMFYLLTYLFTPATYQLHVREVFIIVRHGSQLNRLINSIMYGWH